MYSRHPQISYDLLIAIMAVLKAGIKIRNDFDTLPFQERNLDAKNNSRQSSFWKSPQQVVTPTDIASHHVIKEFFDTVMENYVMISEEGERVAVKGKEATTIWIVDPLDGSSNFDKQIPLFVVSVALVDKSTSQPLLAAVYNPMTTELFTAAHGQGSYLHVMRKLGNEEELASLSLNALANKLTEGLCCKLSTKPYTPTKDIVDTGSSSPNADYLQRIVGLTKQLDEVVLRDLSASIYIGAKIAQGGMVGSNATDLRLWDIVPIKLLVEEAGGQVSNIHGEDLGLINYISNTMLCYLGTHDQHSEANSKKKFAEAVERDIGTIIAGSSSTFLRNYLIPALEGFKRGVEAGLTH